MYTVNASTLEKQNAFERNFISYETALIYFNRLVTAADAYDIAVIDAWTGEVKFHWTSDDGFVVLDGTIVD